MFKQKIFYNRETITTLNFEVQQITFNVTQIIDPFINSRISANHDNVEGLLANGEIITKWIVSLFYNLFC